MSGFRLGDITFDTRRMVYVHSLRALVCAGLHEALHLRIEQGLRRAVVEVDGALLDYQPEAIVLIGTPVEVRLLGQAPDYVSLGLRRIARRWGSRSGADGQQKLILISENISPPMRKAAESLGFEVHNELVWGRYRFTEREPDASIDMSLFTIFGDARREVLYRHPVHSDVPLFLRGMGKLILPRAMAGRLVEGVVPGERKTARGGAALDRFDAFAILDSEIAPVGKFSALRKEGRIVEVLAGEPSGEVQGFEVRPSHANNEQKPLLV